MILLLFSTVVNVTPAVTGVSTDTTTVTGHAKEDTLSGTATATTGAEATLTSSFTLQTTGSVFGTNRYGTSFYGRPLGAGDVPLPTFTAMPATAKATDRVTIQVFWNLPTNGETLRLVRNGFSVPANQDDGLVLLEQSISSLPVFIDNTFTSDSAGKFFYYSLFNLDGAGNWWRAGDMQALLPQDWGYDSYLLSLVPDYFVEQDNQLADVAAPSGRPPTPAGVTWKDLATSRWSDIQAETWGSVRPPRN